MTKRELQQHVVDLLKQAIDGAVQDGAIFMAEGYVDVTVYLTSHGYWSWSFRGSESLSVEESECVTSTIQANWGSLAPEPVDPECAYY